MTLSQRLPRVIVAAVIAAVLALFGVIQAASMAFVQQPGSLSALVPRAFGLRVYRALDRVAPAAYVEETLANEMLARGDLAAAQRYAIRIPPGGRRDDLLGRIAEARNEPLLAREYYFAAPDIERMQTAIVAMGARDPFGALDWDLRFADRLVALRTHPDAVAETYFQAGLIAQRVQRPAVAMQQFQRAVALAPLDMRYVLNAANEAYFELHDYARAKTLDARGGAINPASANCLAGLGLVAMREGDRAAAHTYAQRARAVGPSPLLGQLEAQLR